jgi:hypothetical protein
MVAEDCHEVFDIIIYVDKKQSNKVKVYIILKETKFKIKFYT